MPKRFTDTDKWKRPSFRELPFKAKLAFLYLCDQCDHAGIWPGDFPQMSFHLGFPVTESNLTEWFGEKVIKFDTDKFFLVTFFEFQYGESKDGFRAKQAAVNKLQRLGLMDSNLKVPRVSPDTSPTLTEVSPDTPSVVECCVVDSFEEGTGETFEPPELAQLWNARMSGMKSVAGKPMPLVDMGRFKKTQERWKAASARICEEPDRARWVDVIDRIARSEFCRGKNDREWLATFDFLTRPRTHIAVMEGEYRCTPRAQLYAPPAQSSSQPDQAQSPPPLSAEQAARLKQEIQTRFGKAGA
ncbi:MAG: hypothetical protein IPJ84_19005 [Bdellovibrionales bacterium]|nr:hypothetical protein [Bdellovibrionales bacterium]